MGAFNEVGAAMTSSKAALAARLVVMATMLDAAVENEAMAQLLYREARRTTSKEREGGSYLRARSASCKLSSGRACRLQASVQHRSSRHGYAAMQAIV